MRVNIAFGPLLFSLLFLCLPFFFSSCWLSCYVYGDKLVDQLEDDVRFLSVDSPEKLGKKNHIEDEAKSSFPQDSSAPGSSSSPGSRSRGSSPDARKKAKDSASAEMFLRMKSFLTSFNRPREKAAKNPPTMKRSEEDGNLTQHQDHPDLSFRPFSAPSFSQHSTQRGVLSPSSSSSSSQKSRLSLAKISGSVVKIFVDSASPDYISPWQMKAPQQTTGYVSVYSVFISSSSFLFFFSPLLISESFLLLVLFFCHHPQVSSSLRTERFSCGWSRKEGLRQLRSTLD